MNKAIKKVIGVCLLFFPSCIAYLAITASSAIYYKIKEIF